METSKPAVPETKQSLKLSARENKVKTNREKYPKVAEGIDLIRAHFPNAKITKIVEKT